MMVKKQTGMLLKIRKRLRKKSGMREKTETEETRKMRDGVRRIKDVRGKEKKTKDGREKEKTDDGRKKTEEDGMKPEKRKRDGREKRRDAKKRDEIVKEKKNGKNVSAGIEIGRELFLRLAIENEIIKWLEKKMSTTSDTISKNETTSPTVVGTKKRKDLTTEIANVNANETTTQLAEKKNETNTKKILLETDTKNDLTTKETTTTNDMLGDRKNDLDLETATNTPKTNDGTAADTDPALEDPEAAHRLKNRQST